MRIIRLVELEEIPWKNGGGVTREIAEQRIGEVLHWRLSMADVASDGPFSDFSGLTRVLTVIDGDGMELRTPEGTLHADLGVPVTFDGALQVTSHLKGGPLRDFNLMFDPSHVAGNVTVLQGPMRHVLTAAPAQTLAIHCLTGTASLGVSGEMQRGDTALQSDEEGVLDLPAEASALLITLGSLA